MPDSHLPEDVVVYNDRSLRKLAWAIAHSQGQFKLILARCNYTSVREQMVERLRSLVGGDIRILRLQASDKILYATIRGFLGDAVPDALMVFGWESVRDLEYLLTSTNQVREEFRKNFPFPIVLWVSDQVQQQLMRLATDFESWATTIEFAIATEELLGFLRQAAEQFFGENFTLSLAEAEQIQLACLDLQRRELVLDEELRASLESLWGFTKYVDDRNRDLEAALAHYQQAWEFWQQSGNLERQGKLLGEMAFCYYLKALPQADLGHSDWQATRRYLEQCLAVFAQVQRPDLVANSMLRFGRIFRSLQDWQQLQTLAQQALQLHQTANKPLELAQDYGFLAEVALAQKQWQEAKGFAERALDSLRQRPAPGVVGYAPSFYRFLLARSQAHLNQPQEAIHNLEAAKEVGSPDPDLQLYLDILRDLQQLYYQQREYLKAFEIKQQRRSIEQQYGLRAFVGAGRIQPQRQAKSILTQIVETRQAASLPETIPPEIAASGRQLDVERLIERIARNDHKLIVIHGQSGVGKSSLISAGLVPALKQKAIGIPPDPRLLEEVGDLISQATRLFQITRLHLLHNR